jgi:mRNA-degrading endonuclease RelE of RelBE toxin-antitoxin system
MDHHVPRAITIELPLPLIHATVWYNQAAWKQNVRLMTMAYTIDYTASAEGDLATFRTYEQRLIVDAIDQQLLSEPHQQTRNQKLLDPNPLATWELRIGRYRVFYDLDTVLWLVLVKAVGWKDHNMLYIRGKEYVL